MLSVVACALPLRAQVPTATPSSISLSAPALSTTPVTQSLTVTGAIENWRIQAVGGFWLRFIVTPTCPGSVNDCTTLNTGTTSITIIADPTGLPVFLYNGSLRITYPGGEVTIPVNFNVGGGANANLLAATPASLTFSAAPSGNSQSQSLSIATTTAGNSVFFATTSNAPWLTTSLGGASVFAPSTLTVIANPAGLVAGTYLGTLTFTPAGGGAVLTVAVTLNVAAAQQLVVNPTAVNFSAPPGGAGLTPIPVAIGVATGPNVPYTATISYAGLAALNWLSTNVSSGQTGTNLILSASAASLPAGQYAATVTISSPGLTPVFLAVGLTISSAPSTPRFVVDVNPITLNVPPAGTASRTFVVSVSTGATIPYSVIPQFISPQNPAVSWLSLTSATGTTPASVTLSANPGALTAGTYTAVLNISSSTPGFTPLTVPVTMNVNSGQSVSFSPGSLSFNYTPGGAIISVQNVAVALNPASPVQSATVTTIPDVAGQTWLTAQLQGPTPGSLAPGSQIAVAVNATGLANGTYTGRVQVSVPFATNPVTQIPVTLVVSGVAGVAPTVLFSSSQLNFTSLVNGTTPDQNLIVSTNTGAAVPYTLSGNTSWLSLLNGSATTPSTTTVRVNPAGLAVGVYNGAIQLVAPGAANNGATVPVSLTVSASSQALVLSPTSLSFVAQASGTPPPPRNVSITSAGANVAYTVTSNQNWLQGIASTDITPGNIAVYVNPAGLGVGTYSGNLTVFSTNFSLTLPVTLEITSGALLRLSQQSLTFNYQSGFALPAPRTILVSTSSGATLGTAIVASTASGGNWLIVTPASVQTPGGFSVSIANSVAASLAAGSYSGTVTVSVPGNASLFATINVTLNIGNNALLTMSTTPAAFFAEVNGNSPPAQTRTITSTSGAIALATSVSTSTGAGWLTAFLSSGATPSTLTINASPVGLSAGVYAGSVTVSVPNSSSIGSNALVIPVSLTVGGPTLSADRTELSFSGAGNLSPQTIQINSTSGSLSYGVATSVSNSTTNWLSVNANTGTAPSSITVNANASQLLDGTYFGVVTVTPLNSAGPAILVPVTLTVNRTTALQATPATVNFIQLRGGAAPPPQVLQVTSQLPVPFAFSVQNQTGGNWLTVTQSAVVSNSTLQVGLNSNAAALAPGNYSATITIFEVSPTGPPSSSLLVTVNLSVVAQNVLMATPTTINLNGRLGQGNPPLQTVQVTSSVAGVPLSFNALSDVPWLSTNPLAATTPASLAVSVNTAALPAGINLHVGRITLVPLVGGQTVTITVSFVVDPAPTPAITAFTNAATFQPGPLAPGMIFTIVGTNLGPAQGVEATVTNGRFPTTLSGVRVLFDGIPAPVLFASSTQVNAIVPYSLLGRAFAQMSVDYNNQNSAALAPRLADTAPGIFTTDGRQAAALNQDGTVNSAANPAAAGNIVVLFVTGEGQTSPGGVDGEVVAATNLKRPLAAVRVRINGAEVPASEILYAGSAPTLVAGLMQINLRIPAGTPANAATPVEVIVGAAASPAGTTIAVR